MKERHLLSRWSFGSSPRRWLLVGALLLLMLVLGLTYGLP